MTKATANNENNNHHHHHHNNNIKQPIHRQRLSARPRIQARLEVHALMSAVVERETITPTSNYNYDPDEKL